MRTLKETLDGVAGGQEVLKAMQHLFENRDAKAYPLQSRKSISKKELTNAIQKFVGKPVIGLTLLSLTELGVSTPDQSTTDFLEQKGICVGTFLSRILESKCDQVAMIGEDVGLNQMIFAELNDVRLGLEMSYPQLMHLGEDMEWYISIMGMLDRLCMCAIGFALSENAEAVGQVLPLLRMSKDCLVVCEHKEIQGHWYVLTH